MQLVGTNIFHIWITGVGTILVLKVLGKCRQLLCQNVMKIIWTKIAFGGFFGYFLVVLFCFVVLFGFVLFFPQNNKKIFCKILISARQGSKSLISNLNSELSIILIYACACKPISKEPGLSCHYWNTVFFFLLTASVAHPGWYLLPCV